MVSSRRTPWKAASSKSQIFLSILVFLYRFLLHNSGQENLHLMNSEIEVERLRELYRTSTAAKAILDDFADRSNNQRVTKVDQILHRLRSIDLTRSAAIATFRELEKCKCGRFIEGRKGHASRFEWSQNSTFVGKAARPEGSDSAEIALVSGIESSRTSSPDGLSPHYFPLRPGVEAKLAIPADFSAREAERLATWVKTLAIPEN